MSNILSQEEIDALLDFDEDDNNYNPKFKNPERFLNEINPLNFSNFLVSSIEEVIEELIDENFEFQLLGDKSFKSECQIIFDDFQIHFNGDFVIYMVEKVLAGEFTKRKIDDKDYDIMCSYVPNYIVENIEDIIMEKFENSLEYKFRDKTDFIEDRNNLFVYRYKKEDANLMIGIYIKNIKIKPEENIESISKVIEILENGQAEIFRNSRIRYKLNDIKKVIEFLRNLS